MLIENYNQLTTFKVFGSRNIYIAVTTLLIFSTDKFFETDSPEDKDATSAMGNDMKFVV